MSAGILTEERKQLLDRYALLLKFDSTVVQKILVEISNQQ